jgi:hypothetical protein
MSGDAWSLLDAALRERLGVAREGEGWLGVKIGPSKVSVVVTRRDGLIELVAGVLPTTRASAERMLALARRIDAGGLASEGGAYLLKEILPLDERAAEMVVAAAQRLGAEAARLRARALDRPIAGTDLFANYSR